MTAFLVFFIITAVGFVWHMILHMQSGKGKFAKHQHFAGGISVALSWVGWWGMIFANQPEIKAIVVGIIHELPLPWVGWALAILGAVLMFLSFTFHKKQAPEDKLIDKGIYGIIRNPMYLGWGVFMVGVPFITSSLWALYTAPIWIAILIYWTRAEEKELLEKFGKEYKKYKDKTWF